MLPLTVPHADELTELETVAHPDGLDESVADTLPLEHGDAVGDGDTLYVRQESGRPRAVRLQGIDAPEICQDGGAAAREALQERVLGQPVRLLQVGTDDYGRELAVVYWRGQDLGRWLVEQGLAWSYAVGSQRAPYATEQGQAREQKRGLFAQPAPEPPWRFRRRHGSCKSMP